MVKNRLKMQIKNSKFKVVHGGTTLCEDEKSPNTSLKTVSLQDVVLQCFFSFCTMVRRVC